DRTSGASVATTRTRRSPSQKAKTDRSRETSCGVERVGGGGVTEADAKVKGEIDRPQNQIGGSLGAASRDSSPSRSAKADVDKRTMDKNGYKFKSV
uniref:Microtubule-associated protein Jupiter n=1 Tax=Steinernema glaseri TaxID=37863 RepID=A0A1I8AF70_9BILA